ncbi:MAG: hypothetical protein HQL56_00985 [Magnetococcales bacterium]|nr:hypothetical protein [Magnetococcales bacterium]
METTPTTPATKATRGPSASDKVWAIKVVSDWLSRFPGVDPEALNLATVNTIEKCTGIPMDDFREIIPTKEEMAKAAKPVRRTTTRTRSEA